MKLSLTLIDQRHNYDNGYNYATSKPKFEDYTRVEVVDLTGNRAVVAATLRGIADDIEAPQ